MDDTAVREDLEETIPGGGGTSSRRAHLEQALAALPDRQRHVLSLRYLAGLDDIEVSEALGISVKAVGRHAARGIAALRAESGEILVDSFLLR